MQQTRKVLGQMGKFSLIFVAIDPKKKTYQLVNNGKSYRMHQKWMAHLQYFLGYRYAAVLVEEVQSTSASGSSYDIVHVAAVFATQDQCQEENLAFWSGLKVNKDKHEYTLGYLYNLRERMMETRTEHHFFIPALEHMATVCAVDIFTNDAASTIVF